MLRQDLIRPPLHTPSGLVRSVSAGETIVPDPKARLQIWAEAQWRGLGHPALVRSTQKRGIEGPTIGERRCCSAPSREPLPTWVQRHPILLTESLLSYNDPNLPLFC